MPRVISAGVHSLFCVQCLSFGGCVPGALTKCIFAGVDEILHVSLLGLPNAGAVYLSFLLRDDVE